jgi:hypothetical protein
MLEEHLAVGWEYDVEVVIDAPAEAMARCLPRAVGRLEPLDAGSSRLVGSTSNPVWYAEQLAVIPARTGSSSAPSSRRPPVSSASGSWRRVRVRGAVPGECMGPGPWAASCGGCSVSSVP